MWPFTFRKTRRPGSVWRHCPPCRPHLEVLEDRCLLNAGYLDPTFGPAGAGLVPQGGAVLIQPNGQALAFNGGSVARYNTDGSLDTSFGSSGTAQANIGGAEALQPDGKILLAGIVRNSSGQAFVLERLNSNGSVDTSFGNQGEVTTSITSIYNFVNDAVGEDIVVQPNGQIVVDASHVVSVKIARLTYQLTAYIDVARYNTDGSLDTSFGNNGVVSTPLPSNFAGIHTDALLLQPNGELIVVADGGFNSEGQWAMVRYNTDGSLDTSFGSQGIATTPLVSNSRATVDGAVLYPSTDPVNGGKIAVVGNNPAFSSGPLMARFNTNGSLDTTFGSGGFASLGVSNPDGGVFDSSERLVIGGTVNANTNNSSLALERLNSDGTPDTTFGGSGVVSEGIPGVGGAGGPAIYPSTDPADAGKIAVGSSFVARFLPSAPASAPNFIVTGSGSTTAGALYTITVTATDANGNVLTTYTGTVDFGSLDPQAVLLQPYTFTASDQGVHAFTVILKTAGQQALFVADTSNPSMNGREVGIQVSPGAPAGFIFLGTPTSVKGGQSFNLAAVAVDAYGNWATFNGTVGFSSSDSSATLPGPESFSQDANLGNFILRKKGMQTITIFDESDPSISGTVTFDVT